jgi:bacterioferritin
MKGDSKVVELLHERLYDELTGIVVYVIQAQVCELWGYAKLAGAIMKDAKEEMGHAERLVERLLFLESMPEVETRKENPGDGVPGILQVTKALESEAIKNYNALAVVARGAKDSGTEELAEALVLDEERHLIWVEGQLEQINQMGLENYLGMQA